jgi:cell wall assembly regulator SMI1
MLMNVEVKMMRIAWADMVVQEATFPGQAKSSAIHLPHCGS